METDRRGSAPDFDIGFRETLETLLVWRRDVRRFHRDPLPEGTLEDLIRQAMLAPSVGNAQPWRFVVVDDPDRRARVRRNFEKANAEAQAEYSGERARAYAALKLAGLDAAPVQLAVYCDDGTDLGAGLGRRTMPEMLTYSVVGAINTLWLAARARGIGLGWVSILEPEDIRDILGVPATWRLIGYLCLGYPEEEHTDPELERAGWQVRADPAPFIVRR